VEARDVDARAPRNLPRAGAFKAARRENRFRGVEDPRLRRSRRFAKWMYELSSVKHEDIDAQIFMLTVNSVLLLFMLDSQQFVTLLDDSIRSPALRPRLRSYIVRLVHTLLNAK
jgi:hypothetical protein